MLHPPRLEAALQRTLLAAEEASVRLRVSRLAQRLRRRGLTYLSPRKLHNLEHCMQTVAAAGVAGDFVEAGIALGGSAILLAGGTKRLSSQPRRFIGYDVFDLIPAPGPNDAGDAHARYQIIESGQARGIRGQGEYYGYVDDLYGRVVANFQEFGLQVDGDRIQLHKGLFQETLCRSPPAKVALAHLDCDWYEPVAQCLQAIVPSLSPGGYIIADDYHDYTGCRRAVHEALARHAQLRVVRSDSNLVIQHTP